VNLCFAAWGLSSIWKYKIQVDHNTHDDDEYLLIYNLVLWMIWMRFLLICIFIGAIIIYFFLISILYLSGHRIYS
jgi:hypothetical protein